MDSTRSPQVFMISMIRIKRYFLEQNHNNHMNHSSDKGITT
jgi:hypothetical protein